MGGSVNSWLLSDVIRKVKKFPYHLSNPIPLILNTPILWSYGPKYFFPCYTMVSGGWLMWNVEGNMPSFTNIQYRFGSFTHLHWDPSTVPFKMIFYHLLPIIWVLLPFLSRVFGGPRYSHGPQLPMLREAWRTGHGRGPAVHRGAAPLAPQRGGQLLVKPWCRGWEDQSLGFLGVSVYALCVYIYIYNYDIYIYNYNMYIYIIIICIYIYI